MEFDELLAPVAGEFDVDEALATWRWVVPENASPLVLTAFGDLFLTTPSGSVLFLDTAEGTSHEVASSVREWEEKCRDPEWINQWFMPGFLAELHEAGAYLSQGECYDATHPIILGGAFSVENWTPTHWRVHFHSLGQIHEQVKDLPAGTAITKIAYTKI
jgi:hypothetical protein